MPHPTFHTLLNRIIIISPQSTMKYIQDDQLAQWTSALTDVSIGHSRLLHGRLEVYSMKRVTSEKKDAVRLGEKYVEQIQQDQEASNILNIANPTRRKRRSVSAGRLEEASSVTFAADARTMGNATTACAKAISQ